MDNKDIERTVKTSIRALSFVSDKTSIDKFQLLKMEMILLILLD